MSVLPTELVTTKRLTEIEHWLTHRIAAISGIPVTVIERTTSFNRLGLDSVLKVSLACEFERQIGSPIDSEFLYRYQTIASVVEALAARTA
jgi:acyl carrier protein